jgi:methionyl-tRNA formyltransferase
LLVGCGTGILEVLELQMPGSKRLHVRDFLLGNTLSGTFIV